MKIEQEFFKKLKNKSGGHPLKERLAEELKGHVEDSIAYKKESVDHSIERLGKPGKIARELKEVYFSFQRCGVYVAIYFTILLPLSLFVSITYFHDIKMFLFSTGFAPFFTIIVSPFVGFIFGFYKRFEYSLKEIVLYGIGVEMVKAMIIAILMIFTTQLYAMSDPDVRPYLPHLFLIETSLGAFCSWGGGAFGQLCRNFIRKPPMVDT